MKHLITILAVFLLMGCQTTENTPKNIASVNLDKAEQKTKVPESQTNVIKTAKPMICGPAAEAHSGLAKNAGEGPILLWRDISGTYFSALWMNKETGTISVLEYPQGPDLACFSSMGTQAVFNEEPKVGISIKAQRFYRTP